jgi:multiple sugar transport system ATP-binding protein
VYEAVPAGASTAFAHVAARVEAVEPLGAETLVMLTLADSTTELIARIGRDTALSRGDRVKLAVDTTTLHFFDPATTKAIA